MTVRLGRGLSGLDQLTEEAVSLGILVDFSILRRSDNLDGLFLEWPDGSVILINSSRPADIQTVSLAEELGHYHKSAGHILRQDDVQSRKSENAGKAWCYKKLLPPEAINFAVSSGICSPWELADKLGLDESLIQDAMLYYERKGMLPTLCGWCSVG